MTHFQSKEYEIRLAQRTAKALQKIPEPYRSRIVGALRYLSQDPHTGKALQGEMKGLFSARVWPYRIIYRFSPSKHILEVADIGHRQGVYK